MTLLLSIAKELLGLFVDDGSLALAILALVLGVAAAASLGLEPLLTGALLFLGCAALLVENVHRTVQGKRRAMRR